MGDAHSFVTEPTADKQNLFSLSYRGLSGRKEMFCMLGWYFLLKTVLKFGIFMLLMASLLDLSAYWALLLIPIALFFILFVVPLFVRRARQMGAAWYGVLVVVLHCLPALGAVWLVRFGTYEGDPCVRVISYSALAAVIASLPLYVYGGTFSGKKSELMRAAIAGDMERVRCLAEGAYGAVAARSERGLTARDYALRMGHTEIADYLSSLETPPSLQKKLSQGSGQNRL